jgi:anti-sigma factor RsiW
MRETERSKVHGLLHVAIDGELDAVDMMRFEAHLAECPDCSADYARLTALNAAIRTQASRYTAPAELRIALMRSWMAQEAAPRNVVPFPTKRGQGWLRPAAGGFTIGAALAASLAVMIATRNIGDAVTDSVVAAHIRGLQPGHLTDVQISDQHQVKPWFVGKIDLDPPVKELGDHGFDLVGCRLDYIEDREAAVVVYRHKLHVLDLFIARADDKPTQNQATLVSQATASGYNVEHWSGDSQDYWVISDLTHEELTDFARAWQEK